MVWLQYRQIKLFTTTILL